MLTGDKKETAINVSLLAKIISENSKVIELDFFNLFD
jgi:magnesium-transporting ATPase (P-type)